MMRLYDYIRTDRMPYPPRFSKAGLLDWLLSSEQYWIRSFVMQLRREEYYTWHRPNWLKRMYYRRKRNRLGRRLGFIVSPGNFGPGLKLYHYGSVIVHPDARIGKDCTIHGNCCIGSKGGYPDLAPHIGDRVDIGQGAQILGGIRIADDVRIGAGAIVTKSIVEPGVTVVGVPARVIHAKGAADKNDDETA